MVASPVTAGNKQCQFRKSVRWIHPAAYPARFSFTQSYQIWLSLQVICFILWNLWFPFSSSWESSSNTLPVYPILWYLEYGAWNLIHFVALVKTEQIFYNWTSHSYPITNFTFITLAAFFTLHHKEVMNFSIRLIFAPNPLASLSSPGYLRLKTQHLWCVTWHLAHFFPWHPPSTT